MIPTNSISAKAIRKPSMVMVLPISRNRANIIIGAGLLFLMCMVLSAVVTAQTAGKLNAAIQGAGDGKSILSSVKAEEYQRKQSGQMFEYLSMPAAGSLNSGWYAEPLAVVFTEVDSLPAFAGNATNWNRILETHNATIVTNYGESAAGKQVQISYLIDANGDWCDIRFVQPVSIDLTKKAMALLHAAGKCKPAINQGQAVAYRGNIILNLQ